MRDILKKIKFLIKRIKLKKDKIFLHSTTNFEGTIFGGNQKIGKNTSIKNSVLGFGSYIGRGCSIESTKIGKYCSIGDQVSIVSGNHPLNYISTHPFAHSSYLKKQGFDFKNIHLFQGERKLKGEKYTVEIKNDVWIGTGVKILGGLTIGNGAVLGTGAVITKDIPPYSIVVGVPGKVIGYRFNAEEIKEIENIKWWDKDLKWLERNIDKFVSIDRFKDFE